MPALLLLESPSTYAPERLDLPDWRIGSTSFEAPPQMVRRPYLRLVDKSERFEHDRPLDATEEQSARAVEQAVKTARAMREVKDRIHALFNEAIIAGERYSLTSAIDMTIFLRMLGITQRPSIYLLDNGNLQAVWRNAEKEQVSLQFFGDNVIQFAMFARRPGLLMARIAGQDSTDQVRVKLSEHGCRHLIV